MERLTKRDTDGQAMMDCEKCKADWTGKRRPEVDLYPAQMKIRWEKGENDGTTDCT